MAENKSGAAQNKLGELFVDLGSKGFPTLLKQLNSVSATFLLGKNAANQFVQTLSKPFKEAGNSAVEIGKMSNALATSSIEYQKLAMYLKKYNLGESLLGDVSKLEQTFYDISQGFIDIPGSMAVAFNQAGLSIKNYRGTFQDTIKLLDDLNSATSKMSKEKRNQIFRQVGISSDWGYLFDKGGRASDFATISDEAIKTNQNLLESMNELKNTTEVLKQELLAQIAPHLKTIADFLTNWMKNFHAGSGEAKTINKIKDAGKYIDINEGGQNLLIKTPLGSYALMGALGKAAIQGTLNKGKATGQAADLGYIGDLPEFKEGTELPPNISNMTQSITNHISHDITINGNNANEIANRIASISAQDIQYTQYQANNLTGV